MAANTQNGEEKTNESGARGGTVLCGGRTGGFELAKRLESIGAIGNCERSCNLSE